MDALWKSDSPGRWRTALNAVDERINRHSKDGYPELDQWYFQELPKMLDEQKGPKQLDASQIVKIVEWKMKRGSWRPNLLKFARSLSDEEVHNSTQEAWAAAQDIGKEDDAGYKAIAEKALKHLTKLKGVGPATASAIMTAFYPSFCYMGDESMDVVIGTPREYTMKRYLEFAAAVRSKAETLSSEGERWSAREVERALQSEALVHKQSSSKRKRAS